jgi:hypothetical protein
MHTLDGAREFTVLESVTKLHEGVAQLGPGECAQAEVLADAETDVHVRLAIDGRRRIRKHILVAFAE